MGHRATLEAMPGPARATETLFHRDSHVEIHRLVVGPLDNNVWIVRCTETGAAVLIDAANEHGRLLEMCRVLGVDRVVETHGHWDHIQAVPHLRAAGISVAVEANDATLLPSYDQILHDESVVDLGRLRMRTLHTPGHTPGSMCFALDRGDDPPFLFTGDTLFPGGPGNTALPGGDFATIIRSIDERIFAAFADTTLILPGHGDTTVLAKERPHLEEWVERGW